jgi:hypothetical protein
MFPLRFTFSSFLINTISMLNWAADASGSSETRGAKKMPHIRLDLAKKEMNLNINFQTFSSIKVDNPEKSFEWNLK